MSNLLQDNLMIFFPEVTSVCIKSHSNLQITRSYSFIIKSYHVGLSEIRLKTKINISKLQWLHNTIDHVTDAILFRHIRRNRVGKRGTEN